MRVALIFRCAKIENNVRLAHQIAWRGLLTHCTSIAITQVGSTFHYMMGQIAERQKFDLATVTLKPLQGVPNMVAAVKSGQVDAALMPPQFARPLLERNEAKLLGYYSGVADYQYGAVFASLKLVTTNPDVVQRFVRAYQKGNADYAKAFLRLTPAGESVVDAASREAAELIAKHVYPGDVAEKAIPNILASIVFVDGTGKLDTADIDRQVAWYKKEKLVNESVDPKTFVDTSFAH